MAISTAAWPDNACRAGRSRSAAAPAISRNTPPTSSPRTSLLPRGSTSSPTRSFCPSAGSLANIVMFDVLHHLEFPRAFFAEATRVLSPGGRVVMVEPAITAASWPFYRFVHPEPVRMGDDPLREGRPQQRRDPFAANQAFPTLLATRHRHRFAALFPRLDLIRVEWLSLFAYPLSGGFRPWSAIPVGMVADVLRLESRLVPWLGRLMAFRMLMVVEAKT